MAGLDDKTFVVGIGAQKAGTSWLHDYLAGRSDCFMSPIKELHYFDSVFVPEIPMPLNEILERAVLRLKSSSNLDLKHDPWIAALMERLEMSYDAGAYRRFFELRVPAGVPVFGEITPSYALLPERGFQAIKRQFPKVRVIFILRDPIDRQFSQLRMKERKGYTHLGGKVDFLGSLSEHTKDWPTYTTLTPEQRFVTALSDIRITRRSHYHLTIRRLEAVFEPTEFLILFYETLFQDSSIRKLCDFLEIPFIAGDYQKPVNVADSQARDAIPRDQRELARPCFLEVYAYCQQRFGKELPESWLY